MLLLTSTSDLVQVVTSSTAAVDVHASWVDNNAGTITPGRTNTAITTATTTTVIASPAASTQRNLQTLNLANKDASVSNAITVKHTDGTTAVTMFTVTLAAGEELQFLDGVGWVHFDVTGAIIGRGTTGPIGATGVGLPLMLRGDDADEPMPAFGLPTGMPNRSQLGPDAKNWSFLGTISGTGVTVGPLIWTGQFQQIYFEYLIGGYNGGTPIGRIQLGTASISTTAANNGNGLNENGTNNATSVNVPGCPLAVTTSAIARQGRGTISGASGSLKQIVIEGMSGNPAAATSPTVFQARSFFTDISTNLLIQRLQLSVYDTLIATALSAQTFTATTQLWAWGRNND